MSALQLKLGQRIKQFRERVGLSQQKLSEMIEISRPTLSQIESDERKINTDELIRFADIFNITVENLLNLRKEPEVMLAESKKDRGMQPNIRINIPQKNLSKFKEVLIYILNKVGSKPNIGETVVYKLLYFIDFDYYEKFEEQLIGASYIKNHYGPTPLEFRKIVDLMEKNKEIEKVKSEYYSFPQTKYFPLRNPDLSRLNANEIQLIDGVLSRLSDMNASQISEYSHNDVPWLTTEKGEVIEYESVFYRTAPYSQRSDEEDIR